MFTIVSLFTAIAWTAASVPFLRIVKNTSPGESLLHNGDFEQARDAKAAAWSAGPLGYRLAPGEGRGGSTAMVCENPSGNG